MGAGKGARIKIAGTPVSATSQDCENVAGLIYQIEDRDKCVWDRTVTPVVKDNGGTVSAANILYFNYLTGRLEFVSGYSVSGAITVDVDYRPMTTITYCRTADLTETSELEDITTFATAATDIAASGLPSRKRAVVMNTCNGTVGGFYDFTDCLEVELKAATTVILEFQDDYNDDTDLVYVEAFLPSLSINFNVESMNQVTINFESTYPVEYE